MRYGTKQLSVIVIFSSLGAVLSVPIGYAGNYMKVIPALPLGTGQALAGLHLITVVLASLLVRRRGAAVATATVKGLLEAVLFSFHGLPVILISSAQGLVIDAALYLAGYDSTPALSLGCGLASASNVAFLQFVLLMPYPPEVFAFMYAVAFLSGAALGGLLSVKLYNMVRVRVSVLEGP
jgi:ABC-type thiamin/hydroxymethylpyrimidine transport system permease subunit